GCRSHPSARADRRSPAARPSWPAGRVVGSQALIRPHVDDPVCHGQPVAREPTVPAGPQGRALVLVSTVLTVGDAGRVERSHLIALPPHVRHSVRHCHVAGSVLATRVPNRTAVPGLALRAMLDTGSIE